MPDAYQAGMCLAIGGLVVAVMLILWGVSRLAKK